jgi:methionine-rich copper-binding protein CopC
MVLCIAFLMLGLPAPAARAVQSCGNTIACENQLPGTPQSVWDNGTDDQTILGFATQMSATPGGSISFKINTNAKAYSITIYRLGYYQGNGARQIATVPVSVPLPQTQPACLRDTATDLFDCGGWAVSASWQVPTTAVSGVYIADLVRSDTGTGSHIPFIVRNDASHSDVVFQTSDTTWQAYNTYGGASLYQGVNQPRGYKVSYNRPFIDRDTNAQRDYLYANEYPTIRFLEANGMDVTYVSELDVAMGQGNLGNHKVYMSVGHDEYWSPNQRDAVTKARDAGVNLMFLSGNEIFWRTRWESSIDGTSTAYRTMVCYKDTRADTQIDPVSPTSTWRDPRFAGFQPENSLSGTMYMMQGTSVPLTITADQGKTRMWRNTSLANLSPGTSATVASDLVGYEADEQIENGYGPAGEIALSTTVANVNEMLQDFGLVASPGTLTHHFSEYRAPSGALVFSAGTIQYGWGLDATHDLSTHGAIPQVQQLTINLFADMGAQPATLQTGLVAGTASSDHTAPVVTISQPSNTTLTEGSQVTVSGTATDAGGLVAGVEVTVDGGASWHAATGTASWSYTAPLRSYNATAIQVRATDDSLNTSAPVSATGVTVTGPTRVFGDWVPPTPDSGDASATTLGMAFTASADGYVNGVRFYKSTSNTGTHIGYLYSSSGAVLASGTFVNETASGWQTLMFSSPVAITSGVRYVVAYYAPAGHYAYGDYFFSYWPLRTGSVTAIGGPGTANGVFTYGSGFPSSSWHQSNYWVDVIYDLPPNTPLLGGAVNPVAGAGSVLTTSNAVGRFNKDPNDSTMSITLTTSGGTAVSGTGSFDSGTNQLTFTPAQPLAYATTFTATISDAQMTAPYTWQFTTVAAPATPGVCPCSFFQDTTQPTTIATTDVSNLALGTAFTPSQSGSITGVRYWKPYGLVGPNTVTLYGPTGAALATATASGQTTVGWQTASFPTWVNVTAGTTYTAAVTYPSGGYPYAYNVFANPLTVGPLTAPANAGRYVYGGGYPTSTTSSSYFIDPVFVTGMTSPPYVTGMSPGNGATSVMVGTSVTATFAQPVATGSGTVTLTGPSGQVAGTVTGTDTTRTFTPTSALAAGTAYTLRVTGAVTPDGVVQTQNFSGTFTTAGVNACPCSLLETTSSPAQPDLANGAALTLGLKFSPTVNGSITGLRYWRAASNTGAHVGKLWAADGTMLASVAFVDGPAGWTQASLSTAVSVTAGTSYYASYYTPGGAYSATTGAFATQMVNPPLQSMDSGGVFASGDAFPSQSYGAPNYFVDVVFTPTAPPDPAPAVTSVSPANGATGVATTTSVTVNFSGSFNASSVSIALAGPGGAVAGSLSTGATSATFTPTAALGNGTTYTVTVNASSPGGTAMAPVTSSFTTVITPTTVNVASTNPATSATGVPVNSTIGVTFGGSLSPSSVSLTLTPNGGTAVAGTLTTTATTATFTPSAALLESTFYTATVNASSSSGAAMAPYTWQFSTVSPAPVILSRSPASGATGVAANAAVTVTFTKAVDPTKSTLGLVNASGLAVQGTLSTTSTSVAFTPLSVLSASTKYTATVGASSPLGTAMTPSSWSFTTESAPTVSAITPANGATGVSNGTTVKATFSKAVSQSSISIVVTDPNGAAVAGTLATTGTSGTFTPSALLAPATSYSVSVNAKLADGLPSTPFTSSFTTGAAVSIFAASLTPATSTQTASPLTVGVKFTSTTRYWITGIKFYLPANATSTYTVTLWSSTGTKLATGSGSPTSTTDGWRTVNLTTPYRIAANTTYVASVRALSGQYSSTPLAFVTPYTNGAFTVPASGGVTSSTDVFPTATSSTNYFVDVVAAP